MPIQYEGIIASTAGAVSRQPCSISAYGEFQFTGDIVASGLEDLFTFSISAIRSAAQSTVFC